MALAPLNFVDYGKKGRHFSQPSHSFSSAKIRSTLESEETPRSKEKFDRIWKQKWEALHGRGKDAEPVPKRVDWGDVAHLPNAHKWAQPDSSRATSTEVTPGRAARMGMTAPDSLSPAAVGSMKLTGVAKSSIKGFCPTQPVEQDRKQPPLILSGSTGDLTGQFFSATCNRQYGDTVATMSMSSSEAYLRVKPSKLAGGKCLRPPTSNSTYGYFTQLKVHKPNIKKRPKCNETAFVQNLIENKVPYAGPEVRFVGHEHHEPN